MVLFLIVTEIYISLIVNMIYRFNIFSSQDLIIQPVRFALEHYRKLNEAAKKASEEAEAALEPTVEEEELQIERPNSRLSRENSKKVVQKTESSFSIGSRASSRISMYRSSTCDYGDGTELDTETEVDVSERTSRFKIATDIHISPSRRNSSERRSSVGGRSSCERTVSPRTLEERLLPHAEAKNEPEDGEVLPKKSEKESLFARFRIFSERLSSSDKERTSNGSTMMSSRSTRCKQSGLQSVLKRSRSKSEPTKSRHHRTFHISRPRISFGTNPQKMPCSENMFNNHDKEKAKDKCKESSSEGLISSLEIKTSTSFELVEPKRKPCVASSAQPSPTLSEKCVLVTNSILKHKGFSLSLDVLPRKNGRLRRSAATETHTPENTPGSSEDNLLEESKRQQVDGAARFSRHQTFFSQTKGVHSPEGLKGFKKKPESTRALLFKSLSFRKKSPTKEDEMRHSDSCGPSEERL